jgi:hypothetical protein
LEYLEDVNRQEGWRTGKGVLKVADRASGEIEIEMQYEQFCEKRESTMFRSSIVSHKKSMKSVECRVSSVECRVQSAEQQVDCYAVQARGA